MKPGMIPICLIKESNSINPPIKSFNHLPNTIMKLDKLIAALHLEMNHTDSVDKFIFAKMIDMLDDNSIVSALLEFVRDNPQFLQDDKISPTKKSFASYSELKTIQDKENAELYGEIIQEDKNSSEQLKDWLSVLPPISLDNLDVPGENELPDEDSVKYFRELIEKELTDEDNLAVIAERNGERF